jgi:hypothetical protein
LLKNTNTVDKEIQKDLQFGGASPATPHNSTQT